MIEREVDNHIEKREEISEIEKLVTYMNAKDSYILDSENAIVLIENEDKSQHKESYMMIHYRLVGKKLIEVNHWYMNGYCFGYIHSITPIKKYNLLQIQNGVGDFNALYNYKEDRFVVPQGVWNVVDSGRNHEFLKKYNCFIASFKVCSTYDEENLKSYINPVTNEEMFVSFREEEGNYYAILDIDGTIRDNTLLLGSSISRIKKRVPLDEYESVLAFQEKRRQLCNEKKAKKKQEYLEMIEARNDGSISPYLDTEVTRILELKK